MAIDLGGGGPRRVRPSMNVTPLVDVVLVLLIIFMVITPLMSRAMSVNVPIEADDAEAAPPGEAEPQVVLTVTAEGRARLGREPVEDAALPDTLRAVFAARRDQTLFFDAAGDAPYGRAVEVLDLARGAGVVTIAVLSEEIAE